MSTGLELIPFALAIGGAARAASQAAHQMQASAVLNADSRRRAASVRALPTRFRDAALVLEALGNGAVERNGTLHGVVDNVPVALVSDAEGTYAAYFHGDLPLADAKTVVHRLDEIYGGLVQRDIRRRVLEQAPASGLALEHEAVEDDGSIVLTLRVGG